MFRDRRIRKSPEAQLHNAVSARQKKTSGKTEEDAAGKEAGKEAGDSSERRLLHAETHRTERTERTERLRCRCARKHEHEHAWTRAPWTYYIVVRNDEEEGIRQKIRFYQIPTRRS